MLGIIGVDAIVEEQNEMEKRWQWRCGGRSLLRSEVVHVVYHGDEEIEEELAAILHFSLHCAAALERVSGSNDEREVVCTEFGVGVGSVGVGVTGRCQDSGALDTGLEALFLERQLLQLLESVFVGLAVDDGVL